MIYQSVNPAASPTQRRVSGLRRRGPRRRRSWLYASDRSLELRFWALGKRQSKRRRALKGLLSLAHNLRAKAAR